MTKEERLVLTKRLIEETRRIGELVRDVTPEGGHLSLTWFPDEHVDLYIYGGQNHQPEYIIDAWQCSKEGKVYFGHE